MKINEKVLGWYQINKRKLPWRDTTNPYYIWISEIILQQTKIAQGTNYYLRFIEHFPKISDLANATLDEVMKNWQGLGYYSRARNLHTTAKVLVDKYNGEFPTDYSEIRKLKGIGDYTAAAIASIAFNKPYAVVDGNVFRFYSRLYGISYPIDTSFGKKQFTTLAQSLLDTEKAGEYNQAVMEFGALQCSPKKPNCKECIFNIVCKAFSTNSVEIFPVKIKSKKLTIRYLNYIVFDYKSFTFLRLRTQKDIWNNLYEFPEIETDNELSVDEFEKRELPILELQNLKIVSICASKLIKHQLSHQTIMAKFFYVKLCEPMSIYPITWKKIQMEDLENFATSRLTQKYIESLKL